MSSKQAAERLGVTLRHAARLAKIVNVPKEGISFNWETSHLKSAKELLNSRRIGRGRYTVGQVLYGY